MDDITKDRPANNEWSHLLDPQTIKDSGSHVKISANEEERANLARRFGLLDLDTLSANLIVHPARNGKPIHVSGEIKATISQSCVISESPVSTSITEPCEGWFADPKQIISLNKARREKAVKDGNALPILDEKDDPEPFINGKIDLGELVAQSLSLAIPTYPRAPDADFDGHSTTPASDKEKAFTNPFAALAQWKSETKE